MLLYLANFLIILAAIVLFAAPFFLWYYLQHKESLRSIDFNTYLEYFFSSRQANWLIFFWAFGEALIWFVIPEFLLLLIVFMRINRKRQMLIYDIAGTTIGIIAALIIRLPKDSINNLPYVQPKMVEQTEAWYAHSGILGLAQQPFSGVPFKVFTNLAWQYKFNILAFVVVALVVRVIRYLIAYGLFISLYPKLHRLVKINYVWLSIIAIFIFSILLYKVYRGYGPGYEVHL